MKIWSVVALGLGTVNGKRAEKKGWLSVSHRNMFKSDLPIVKPEEGEIMPDFIINGVNKCGTTAASFFLDKHSKLQKAKMETNFFNTDDNYERGFAWYSEQFPPRQDDKMIYEKTPAYYKSHVAPERIKAAKKDIQLVTVVCDNVHRTLSRFLHIQKHAQQKLTTLGYTLEEFDEKLKVAVPEFMKLLSEIKETEGGGTMDGLVKALSLRNKNFLRPFNLKKGDHFEMILADGLYAVHQQSWLDHFSKEQMLVVNGNNFLKTPWIPMKKIQAFLGIDHEITRDSFTVPIEEDGSEGVPCFIEDDESSCIGKGDSEKGRSLHKSFSPEVSKLLHSLFDPFDEFFAHKVLGRKTFKWDFGRDETNEN